jgi:hypothetical protein
MIGDGSTARSKEFVVLRARRTSTEVLSCV